MSEKRFSDPGAAYAQTPEGLARRRMEHVAKAIWAAQFDDEFPPAGTISHAMALNMAVAATEALAQAMEMTS